MTLPRRKRRIAADEAHSWARNLRLRNPYAKLVLAMLTLYVNGDGICFVSIVQLAEDCEFAAETVRRRLMWLESIGAIVRMPQWRDELGRLNSEGRGKRTTDEIRLMIDTDSEVIEAAASGKYEAVEGNSNSDEQEISHPPRRVANEAASHSLAPPLATQQPPSCGGDIISEPEPEPEPSPQPPSGGNVVPEDWRDFEEDWAEPILRQSMAQQVWSALKPDERTLARQAARGYVIWRKGHKKPPNVLGAHLFLKERDAWEKFARLAPAIGGSGPGAYLQDSPEGRAIIVLYEIAAKADFVRQVMIRNGVISYAKPVGPRLLALAQAGPKDGWFVLDHRQAASWENVLRDAVTVQVRKHLLAGDRAPWPWPPSVDGKLYTEATGPPESLMTNEDYAALK